MITLKRLKIRGFRGFMSDREFIFGNPVVFLFGESHHGKSSTLNAIEWCLFGGECIGLRTGIRERVDWEIPNRNMNLPDVLVELELEGSDGLFIIQRTLKPRGRRGGLQEELSLMLPDSTKLSEEQAKERLAQLLRSSFRDFMTTVYQHQEAIRAVLTQEPRERNDAIDRLLGLSDYRDLLDGINAAQLPTKQRQIDEKFEAFNREVETALRTRERGLSEKRQGATESGTAEADLTDAGGLRITHEVLDSLTRFASEVGILPPIVKVPVDWEGLKEFRESAKKEIGRMRAEMPDVEEQGNLFQRRGQLTNLKTQYESKKQSYKEALQRLQEFEKENGDEPAINSKIEQTKQDIEHEKTRLRKTNSRSALVGEAIHYLEQADINQWGNRCPVCGNEAPNLLEHLREEWEQKIRTHGEEIRKKRDALQKDLQQLETALEQHKELVERGVQGVDVDAAQENGEKYGIEVKTTKGIWVNFRQKDTDGLESRLKDGYQPVLAVLQLAPLSEWYFAKADKLKQGRLLVSSLRPYRLLELEDRIKPYFDQAVNEHFNGTMEKAQAQGYLDEVLREKGVDVRR